MFYDNYNYEMVKIIFKNYQNSGNGFDSCTKLKQSREGVFVFLPVIVVYKLRQFYRPGLFNQIKKSIIWLITWVVIRLQGVWSFRCGEIYQNMSEFADEHFFGKLKSKIAIFMLINQFLTLFV